MNNDEILYCSECGSANKMSAVFCENCEKKLDKKHSPFMDYLKSHIKDELRDRATDKIYSVIKNYLLSHIYGAVLTVSVVAVAATTVVANYEPHITKVSENPVQTVVVADAEPAPEIKNIEITQWDCDYFSHITSCYDHLADFRRSSDPYWGGDLYYNSPTEFYAEGNVEGYTYTGVHELYNNPISIGISAAANDAGHIDEARYFPDSTAVSGENLSTELGKKLYSEGFEVAEGDYYIVIYTRPVDWDSWSWTVVPPADTAEKLVYRMVFVKYNDKWYLAEDRLAERVGL